MAPCAPSRDEVAQGGRHNKRFVRGGDNGRGNGEDRGFRPLLEHLLNQGAEKRKQHGCNGAHVFQDPNESDRIWAIFDWDEAGWQSFTSDPEVPAIFQEAGFTQGPPKSAEFLREHCA